MSRLEDKESGWGSRRIYIMLLFCQTIGLSASNVLPNAAINIGALGFIIVYVIIYVIFGIPLIYMEMVIGQFTARDCIDIWKARPCLSHIGYLLVIWQVIILLFNHTMVSFILHYLLISFESPIPYLECGNWADKDCDILKINYSVNEDCIRVNEMLQDYCNDLHVTFPEYQYWRRYMLNLKPYQSNYFIAWRVCLASGLACILIYLSCFKRKRSLQWFIGILTIYPTVGYMLIMTGSMLQKGLVVKYEEALDWDFSIFFKNFRFSLVMQHVIYTMSVGSGLVLNLAATSSFRSPCYANSVIIVVMGAAFTILTVFSTAMMSCPYAYEYSVSPSKIMNTPLSLIFEKIPRLLGEYDYKSFWLILTFSCHAILGLRSTIIIFFNLIEMAARRSAVVARYPGLVSFVGIFALFLLTIPMLSHFGINVMSNVFRRFITLLSTFVVTVECLVFVMWYGLERFSEDVHFMQGLRPKNFMKLAWILSSFVLIYVFCSELCYQTEQTKYFIADTTGKSVLAVALGVNVLVVITKFIVAAVKKNCSQIIELDATWGPKSELLKRSRAMFTAQAMTKEYLYRQYHLQAGILARQRRANIREKYIPNERRVTSY